MDTLISGYCVYIAPFLIALPLMRVWLVFSGMATLAPNCLKSAMGWLRSATVCSHTPAGKVHQP